MRFRRAQVFVGDINDGLTVLLSAHTGVLLKKIISMKGIRQQPPLTVEQPCFYTLKMSQMNSQSS